MYFIMEYTPSRNILYYDSSKKFAPVFGSVPLLHILFYKRIN